MLRHCLPSTESLPAIFFHMTAGAGRRLSSSRLVFTSSWRFGDRNDLVITVNSGLITIPVERTQRCCMCVNSGAWRWCNTTSAPASTAAAAADGAGRSHGRRRGRRQGHVSRRGGGRDQVRAGS